MSSNKNLLKKTVIQTILIKLQSMLILQLFTKEEYKWIMNSKKIFMKISLNPWTSNNK